MNDQREAGSRHTVCGMESGRWTTTTHDWSVGVDAVHLAEARRLAESLGSGLPVHLVLEVLAYADDEAEALGRRGRVSVDLRDREVEVADDGRGTDTRRDERGRPVRKPIMATKDVRFFDADAPPLLPDGLPRRGMSTVSAMSPLLLHENRRTEGSWSQSYVHGVPQDGLREGPPADRTGTSVTFRLPSGEMPGAEQVRELAAGYAHIDVTVGREVSG